MTTPLVSFDHLSVSFAGERSRVRAVQEVSFTIQAGQTDRTQHDQREHGSHDRRNLLQATKFGNFTSVASFVDPADQQEQRTR